MHLQPGQNPAKGRLRVFLEDLLSSIFCETLGHENTPNYLLIHGPKVEKRDRHNQVLSSTSLGGILLPGYWYLPASTSWIDLQLAQLADLMSNLDV